MASVVKVVMVALLASVSQGVTTYDTGAGIVYRLDVTQDVTLERGTTNFNNLEYLIVAKHPDYPNKRSLVQFKDLSSSCTTEHIQSAKMYLYYEYAHKASWYSEAQAPFIPRYLQVHLVKKRWNEAQATSTWRLSGISWTSAWLGLDGTDAEAAPQQGTVTISRNSTKGFVEFDVTNAVKNWAGGVANNGLVIRATNELNLGRDIRFASNAMSDSSKHAYILVHCASTGETTVSLAPSSSIAIHTSPKQSTILSHTSANPSTMLSHTSANPSTILSHTSSKPGAGMVYRLGVIQDVTLERGSTNFNYLQYLIVAKHPDFPNKRSLVQFEDLPSSCTTEQIQSAKMYLYYEYAHKASWYSDAEVPFVPRYLQVHLVKKSWNEAQATSTWRLSGISWTLSWLGLDGTDAEAAPQQGTVTISRNSTKGFVEFDVTNAVKNWAGGVANNGLVIRATNELNLGRDIRFASNAMSDSSKHAYILVHCASTGETTVSPAPSSSIAIHTSPKQSTILSHTSANPSTMLSHTSANPSTILSHTSSKPGVGMVYRLGVIQDVTLERGSTNFNYLQYLIVAKHPDFPNKRSLVQFGRSSQFLHYRANSICQDVSVL